MSGTFFLNSSSSASFTMMTLYREGAENMYFFSSLALTLNEPEEGVAPTDSRRRPDQRLMEDGHWDEANAEKQRLEEKQRTTRREREREAVKAATSPEEGKLKKGGDRTCLNWFEVSLFVCLVLLFSVFLSTHLFFHFVCL